MFTGFQNRTKVTIDDKWGEKTVRNNVNVQHESIVRQVVVSENYTRNFAGWSFTMLYTSFWFKRSPQFLLSGRFLLQVFEFLLFSYDLLMLQPSWRFDLRMSCMLGAMSWCCISHKWDSMSNFWSKRHCAAWCQNMQQLHVQGQFGFKSLNSFLKSSISRSLSASFSCIHMAKYKLHHAISICPTWPRFFLISY